MKTACVILNYNDWEHVIPLVSTVKTFSAIDEIVIVDNQSKDNSRDMLRQQRDEHTHLVVSNKNGGYGYGNNLGVRFAIDELYCTEILIVNPDAIFDNKLVESLKSTLRNDPNIGVVSAIQLDRNGNEINQSAWNLPSIWQYIFSVEYIFRRWAEKFYISADSLHEKVETEVECVAGSLLMVSAEAFREADGYDENVFLYCEETILGFRMKNAGFHSVVRSDVSYLHMHGVSIKKNISSEMTRRNILFKSHEYVLKNYMHATKLQFALGYIVCKISMAEIFLKTVLSR